MMVELPAEVIDEAVRLTRHARAVVDDEEAAAYRAERTEILEEHGYAARIRTDDSGPVLFCYPIDWHADGAIDPTRIEDLDRAVERPLTGADDPDDWATIDAHNRAIAEAVAAEHGSVHGANAEAFADFMANHYARRIETAGARECREFLEEYLPRNAWPTDEQVAKARASLRLTFDAAETEPPPILVAD